MMKSDNELFVQLSPYEVAAYWWVRRIKNVAFEFNNDKDIFDVRKIKFGQMFDYNKLNNSGYRKLYLHLAKSIEERCSGKTKYTIRTHAINNGHTELNKWLKEFIGEEVPNINICEPNGKDTLMTIVLGEEPMVFVGDVDRNGIRHKLASEYKQNPVLCETNAKAQGQGSNEEPNERC